MNIKSILQLVLIGSLTGVITSFGQTYIPGTFNQLANSYAVWLTASFIGGNFLSSQKQALVGGVVVQLIAIAFYYLTSYLRFDMTFGSYGILLFWGMGGLLMGPVLGLAGQWWSRKREDRIGYAIALLSASYLSEGFRNLFEFGYSVGYAFLIIGVGSFILMYRSNSGILKFGLLTGVLTCIMYIGLTYGFGFLYETLTS